jgi:hypothetical protein
MSAVTPYCSRCGFRLESDSDFCPSCGAVQAKPEQSTTPRESHSWMRESTPASPRFDTGSFAPQPPPAQIQYVPYAVASQPNQVQDSGLGYTGRTMGIIAVSLMAVGFIPCVGWLNYINIPFGFVTIVLCIVALSSAKSDSARSSATIGLVLAIVANCAGVFRLILGGGCL